MPLEKGLIYGDRFGHIDRLMDEIREILELEDEEYEEDFELSIKLLLPKIKA